MPHNLRHGSDGQPTSVATKWVKMLRHEMRGEMLAMIGRQLRAHYKQPQDLPPALAALVMRIDERQGLTL
jgi:hypothetical protein